MRLNLIASVLALLAIAASSVTLGADLPPREIWPQAATAVRDGELESARARVTELLNTGRAYGLRSYPTYAIAAAAMANQAASENKDDVVKWGVDAASA